MKKLRISLIGLVLQSIGFILSVAIANSFVEKNEINNVLKYIAIYNFTFGIIAGPLSHSVLVFSKNDLSVGLTVNDYIFKILNNLAHIFFAVYAVYALIGILYLGVDWRITTTVIALMITAKIQLSSQKVVNILNLNGFIAIPLILNAVVPMTATAAVILLSDNLVTMRLGLGYVSGALLFTYLINRYYKTTLPQEENTFRKNVNLVSRMNFFSVFNKSLNIVFPLMYVPFSLVYIFAQDNRFNTLYLSIPIGFAGIISMLNSYGAYLVGIIHRNETKSNDIYLTAVTYRSFGTAIMVFIVFWMVHKYIYVLSYDPTKYVVFFIVLISSVFISQYNILRIGAWEGISHYDFLKHILIRLILLPLTFYFALFFDNSLIYASIFYSIIYALISFMLYLQTIRIKPINFFVVNILLPMVFTGVICLLILQFLSELP